MIPSNPQNEATTLNLQKMHYPILTNHLNHQTNKQQNFEQSEQNKKKQKKNKNNTQSVTPHTMKTSTKTS
jgi:hypothetical protein